jgi:hypothetical protein
MGAFRGVVKLNTQPRAFATMSAPLMEADRWSTEKSSNEK